MGYLRSVVSDGQWVQARLHQAGLVPDPNCTLCLVRGTVQHRLWGDCCASLEDFRRQYGPPLNTIVRRHAKALPNSPLFTRALAPCDIYKAPLPAPEDQLIWAGESRRLSGDLFGDGSGRNVKIAGLRRCGWGIVQLDRNNEVCNSVHGPLPGWEQEVPLAELYALLQALLHCPLGAAMHFHTDCKYVSRGFASGRAGTTQSIHLYAGIWKQIWARIDQINLVDWIEGNNLVHVSWVKAHATFYDVLNGKITSRQRTGNHAADGQAKEGAGTHPDVTSFVERHERRSFFVTLIGKYAARLTAFVHKLGGDATPNRNAWHVAPKGKGAVAVTRHVHEIHQVGHRFICWNCNSHAANLDALTRQSCAPPGEPTPQTDSLGHVLWQLGDSTFCIRCGGRTCTKLRTLKCDCVGAPPSTSTAVALKGLKRGIHPTMGFVGAPYPKGSTALPLEVVDQHLKGAEADMHIEAASLAASSKH